MISVYLRSSHRVKALRSLSVTMDEINRAAVNDFVLMSRSLTSLTLSNVDAASVYMLAGSIKVTVLVGSR